MKRSLLLFFVVLLTIDVNAQGEKSSGIIKGKVEDAKSSHPVAFTNIVVDGTFYGTASNADGFFELKIPGEFLNKNVLFSAVGYKNQISLASELVGKESLVIKLSPQTYGIGEVDINAQSKVIMRILRTASDNIPQNFSNGPFRLIGIYECEKIIDDTVKQFRKANITISDLSGYSRPGRITAFRDRGYYFDNVEKNFRSYSFPDGATNFDDLLDLDWARSRASVLNPGLYRSFELNKEDDQVLNGEKVYVISFKQMAPSLEGSGDFYGSSFKGKIYIAYETFAVIKTEGHIESAKQNRQGRGLAIGSRNSTYYKDVTCNFTVSYRKGIPETILCDRQYTDKGKSVSEMAKLTISAKQKVTGPIILYRDYFEGE